MPAPASLETNLTGANPAPPPQRGARVAHLPLGSVYTVHYGDTLLGRVKLYVVQCSHLLLNGRRAPDGSVRGTVDIRMQEQRTIGTKPGLLGRSPAIPPVPARSDFSLIRVPTNTDCSRLRALSQT